MSELKKRSSLQAVCARLMIASLLCTGVSVMTGCEGNDGTMEEAGEELDQAAEEAGDEIDDALNN